MGICKRFKIRIVSTSEHCHNAEICVTGRILNGLSELNFKALLRIAFRTECIFKWAFSLLLITSCVLSFNRSGSCKMFLSQQSINLSAAKQRNTPYLSFLTLNPPQKNRQVLFSTLRETVTFRRCFLSFASIGLNFEYFFSACPVFFGSLSSFRPPSFTLNLMHLTALTAALFKQFLRCHSG